MAKPNYNFAKRQRDLAKEQKKEEKLQRKKAAAEGGAAELEQDVDTEGDVDAQETGATDGTDDKAPNA